MQRESESHTSALLSLKGRVSECCPHTSTLFPAPLPPPRRAPLPSPSAPFRMCRGRFYFLGNKSKRKLLARRFKSVARPMATTRHVQPFEAKLWFRFVFRFICFFQPIEMSEWSVLWRDVRHPTRHSCYTASATQTDAVRWQKC